MGDFFNAILYPIQLGEAWVLMLWHKLFVLIGIPETSGWSWALAIVGLTAVVRLLLMPLFVKQIHSSRKMQLIQPEMQKIQKKYKGKRDPESQKAQQAEMMDLYKRTGTNPFSSCLPILLQSPFFFALFQLLNNLKAISVGNHAAIGPIDQHYAQLAEKSALFGAQLSDRFIGATNTSTKVLTAILIIFMSATTFITQHQLMRRNMPASALDNPFARQQKVLLYLMPIFFAISGVNFPLGVLMYWLTTNVWTMGQQFYVIRNMPAPGSLAEQAMHDRHRKAGKEVVPLTVPNLTKGEDPTDAAAAEQENAPRQRQQPVSKKRAKKKGGAAAPGAKKPPQANDDGSTSPST